MVLYQINIITIIQSGKGIKMRSVSLGDIDYNHNFMKYKIVASQEYRNKFTHHMPTQNQVNNPVYRHMKTQKILSTIFQGMYGKNDQKLKLKKQQQFTKHLAQTRIKTQSSTQNLSYSRSYMLKRKESASAKEKVERFNKSLKMFKEGIDKSKQKMKVLTKYNRLAKAYEKRIPTDPGQQTRQSIEENEKLLDMCMEGFHGDKKAQEFMEKAQKIKKYKEPALTPEMRKNFIKNKLKRGNKDIRNMIKKSCRNDGW